MSFWQAFSGEPLGVILGYQRQIFPYSPGKVNGEVKSVFTFDTPKEAVEEAKKPIENDREAETLKRFRINRRASSWCGPIIMGN